MKKNQGQVALIVLLISAVMMTLGLSVSKKVTTETKIDTNEELSKQSFNAAESGIDYYLSTKGTNYSSPNSDSKAEVAVNTIGGSDKIDLKRTIFPKANGFFWLVAHNPTTEAIDMTTGYEGDNLSICTVSGFRGSLSLALYYIDASGEYRVNRLGYNYGSGADMTISGYEVPVHYNDCINITSLLCTEPGCKRLLLVATPLFKPTTFILEGNSDFPEQGKEIISTGTAGNLANGVTRKVTVFSGYEVPDFLLEAVSGYQVLSNP